MISNARELLDNALQLPPEERAVLAAELIDSLDSTVDDNHVAPGAWDAEIQRRIAELDSGVVTPIPWSAARKMILGTEDGSSTD